MLTDHILVLSLFCISFFLEGLVFWNSWDFSYSVPLELTCDWTGHARLRLWKVDAERIRKSRNYGAEMPRKGNVVEELV